MQTRAQKYSRLAYEHISQLDQDNELNDVQKKLYSSICHDFPIMVLRSGLAQAVAFLSIKAESDKSNDKSTGKKAENLKSKNKFAYEEFLKHLSSITGHENETYDNFQQRIQKMELGEYQRTTRTILNAAIWYKRFAESLLKVRAVESVDDTEATEEGQSHA
jgi:CRISPR-associated protein Cmr5